VKIATGLLDVLHEVKSVSEVHDHDNGILMSLHGFAGLHILRVYFYC
jgi:hypothetical protein